MGILDQFAGLGNLSEDQTQGLLAAASQILQQSGPSRTPTSLGQILGGGLEAYGAGSAASRKRKQDEEQARQAAELRGLQISGAAGDLQAQTMAREQQAAIDSAARSSVTNGQFDQGRFLQAVRQINPIKASELERVLAKAGPEFDTKPQTAIGPDGKPFQYIIAKNGQIQRLEGVLPRDELKLANLGGRDVAYNPFALQDGQSFQRTQTPDSVASNATAIRGQDLVNARGIEANRIAKGKSDSSDKPLPTAALKLQQSELEALGVASGIQKDLSRVQNQLATGKLDFGPVSNLVARGRNAAGLSNEASRNFSSFQSTLEKLRNDSLRLNSGVQTDGDAQRAWNELFANINDKGVVAQRLEEIQNLNSRAVKLRQLNIDGIRANFGKEPLNTEGYRQPGAAQPARQSVVPGQVVDGYRFKGGEPSQQSSWEKI